MNKKELKIIFEQINELKSKSPMNTCKFCSELTNSDSEEMLDLHYYFLEQKKRYFQSDLKIYFGFRQNKEKVSNYLKNKLKNITDSALKKDISEIIDDIGYKTLDEFKKWFSDLQTGKREDKMKFVWSLMKSPFVEYHYELLLNKDKIDNDFWLSLRGRFDEHGKDAKQLLLSKLDNNEDESFQGEIIFLLGLLRKVKDPRILDYARKLIQNKNDYTRNRAAIVLGWIGTPKDINILGKLQLEDPDINTREVAATQQMHIWFRFKKVKDKVIINLKKAIEIETNDEVLGSIIYTAQEVLKRRFGLKEDKETQKMIGDLQLAKQKASTALKNYIQRNQNKNT